MRAAQPQPCSCKISDAFVALAHVVDRICFAQVRARAFMRGALAHLLLSSKLIVGAWAFGVVAQVFVYSAEEGTAELCRGATR